MKHIRYYTLIVVYIVQSDAFSQCRSEDAADGYLLMANELISQKNENPNLFKDGIELIRTGADLGNAQAVYLTGVFLMLGVGIEKDILEGKKYLEMAATSGCADAMALLVHEFKYGIHLEKNKKKSRAWKRRRLSNKYPYSISHSVTNQNQIQALNRLLTSVIESAYPKSNPVIKDL